MIQTKPPLTKKRSIYPDIFEFARTSTGKRDSVAAILLYTVCPVAARLYLSDIPPVEVPDITTKALVNYVRDGTWEAAVLQSGLEKTLPQIKRYIAKISPRRQRWPGMSFEAELDLLWERDSTMYYFGLQPGMNKLGDPGTAYWNLYVPQHFCYQIGSQECKCALKSRVSSGYLGNR